MNRRTAAGGVLLTLVAFAGLVWLLRDTSGNRDATSTEAITEPEGGPTLEPSGRVAHPSPTAATPSVSSSMHEIRVRVRSAAGQSVSGAQVMVLEAGAGPFDHDLVLITGKSDAGGIYRAKWSGDPIVDLAIEAHGFKTTRREGLDARKIKDVEITVHPGAEIRGRVLSQEDRPLSGVEVLAVSASLPRCQRTTTALPAGDYLDRASTVSGEDGSFQIGGLSASGRYAVTVRAPGFAPVREGTHALDSIVPDGTPVLIRLLPAFRFQYRVVDDETGVSPIDPRLALDSIRRGGPQGSSLAADLPPTDTSGQFPWVCDQVWVAPQDVPELGPFIVAFEVPGYAPFSARLMAARTSAQATKPTTLRLKRSPGWRGSGRLTLRFRDAAGQPVHAARDAIGRPRFLLREVGGPGAFEVAFQPDPQGELTLDPMPAGRWRLVSRLGNMDRRLDLRAATFDVHQAGRTTHTVVMPRHGAISLDWDAGTAPPGYAVVVIQEEGSTRKPTRVHADRFTRGSILVAHVPSGSYLVRVVARGAASEPLTVRVRHNTTTRVPLKSGD